MSNESATKSTGTLRFLAGLQALTLVAVLAQSPTTAPAHGTVPTLPNAAAQRQTMIDVLRQNAEQAKASSTQLDTQLKRIDDRLRTMDGRLAAIEQVASDLSEKEGQ